MILNTRYSFMYLDLQANQLLIGNTKVESFPIYNGIDKESYYKTHKSPAISALYNISYTQVRNK